MGNYSFNGIHYDDYNEIMKAREYYYQQQKIQRELKKQNELMEKQVRIKEQQARVQEQQAKQLERQISRQETSDFLDKCLENTNGEPTPFDVIIAGAFLSFSIGGIIQLIMLDKSTLPSIIVSSVIMVYFILKAISVHIQRKEAKKQEQLKKQQELQEVEIENTIGDPITSYNNKSKNDSFLTKITAIILLLLILIILISVISLI